MINIVRHKVKKPEEPPAWSNHKCDAGEIPKAGLKATLFITPCDSALSQIIGRHLDRDLVAGKNAYKIHPQLTGNMG